MPLCRPRRLWFVALALTFSSLPGGAWGESPTPAETSPPALGASEGTPTAPLSDTEIAVEKFQGFCADWLEKLLHREEENLARIQWETSEAGVRGVYVGYSRRGECEAKLGTDAIPVGKLTYKQVRYEKKGATVEAAEISAARPLEVSEVTEIFHYADGKWIY